MFKLTNVVDLNNNFINLENFALQN